MKPHIVILHNHIVPRLKSRLGKRTTRFYFKFRDFEVVVWEREYRPVSMPRVSDEQIQRARSRMLEFETAAL